MPSSDSSRDALLEQLAEEFVQRHRRGERPTPAEYADRYPDLAADIRDLFPTLVQIEGLRPQAGERTGDFVPPSGSSNGPIPDRLGEYRILRELGQGGMGVVYEAEQESLGRHVALKVLPRPLLLRTTYLERFQREARAAARLHHTNIVPVFGVGEADGTHYYAMQFIAGQGLDRVLDDVRRLRAASGTRTGTAPPTEASVAHSLLTGRFAAAPAVQEPAAGSTTPLAAPDGDSGSASLSSSGPEGHYYRGIARLAVQVADALAYAHRQGILHRDIKPSNLLLDQQGTVWITDFGLAKAEGADDLTQTGDIVGTVRFMAPERFEGRSLPQSDVYALGATLYELLTLRPAFEDVNKGRLVDRVLREPPVPPRKRDSRIPRDLETVVLKCLAKEPAERYPSAEALAEDLRRFLSDRPILARRSSWRERTWRWCRRNPVVASLSSALLLVLVVAAVTGGILNLQLRAALKQAEKRQAETEAAERGRREQTLEALLAEARARRYSGRVGQRYDALTAIRKATALARDLDKPPEVFAELRHLAVAALALPDCRRAARRWEGWPEGSSGLAFDPVALRLYARGDQDGNVSVRRLEDDEEVARLPGNGQARRILFGMDGQSLLLHEPQSGALERWTIGGPAAEKVALLPQETRDESPHTWGFQQSRDGSRLLVLNLTAGGSRARVLELPSGKIAFDQERSVRDGFLPHLAAMSPNGRWLAWVDGTYGSSQRSQVSLFNLATGKSKGVLTNPGNVVSPAWHPDSRTLAVGSANTSEVYVWDAPSGKRLHTLRDLKGGNPYLAMSASGQLLTSMSAWTGGQVFWHPHTGKPLLRTPYRFALQLSVQDGRQYQAVVNQTRIALHIAEPSPVFRAFVPDPAGPEQRSIRDVAIHRDGRLLAVGHTSGVSLIDLATGLEVGRLDLGWTLYLRFDPSSGDLLTSGTAGLLRWPIQVTAGDPEKVVVGPPRSLTRQRRVWSNIDISRDGQVIAAAFGSEAVVFRQEGVRLVAVMLGPIKDNRFVHVSPDGQWVLAVTHDAKNGLIWDARTGRKVGKVPVGTRNRSPHDGYYGTFFSPDGQWLTDGQRRWQVGTWAEGPPVSTGPGPSVLAFSPDGTLFAGQTNDEAVHLVDVSSGKTLVQLGLPEQNRSWYAAFSPDGTQLVLSSAYHNYVYAWDLAALRRHLADLGLDWEAPPLPPSAEKPRRLPLQVTVKDLDPSSVRPLAIVARENAELLRKRGQAFATRGSWEQAAADFSRALELEPDDHLLWYRAVVLQAHLGNKEAYRRLGQQMLERFGGTSDFNIAVRTIKTCLLLPGVLDDQPQLRELIEREVTRQPGERGMAWLCLARGLAAYRAGRPAEAADWLTKGLGKNPNPYAEASAHFVLAMCQQQQRQTEAARGSLDRAKALTARLTKESWQDWLINDMLGREAESLIGSEKPQERIPGPRMP